jgi:CheY-like chemotaxis protein
MPHPSGSEAAHRATTILVVDDEPSICALVRTMLWRAGYTVLEASGGEEALEVAAGHDSPIQLLLADVLMPDMNGYELAEKLRLVRPEARVLYMSGYRDNVLMESAGRSLAQDPFIRKPFTQFSLTAKISELLEDAGQGPSLQIPG